MAMMKTGVKVSFSPSRCSKAFFTFSRHNHRLVTSASTKLVTCGLVRLLITMWSAVRRLMRSISINSSPVSGVILGAATGVGTGAGAGDVLAGAAVWAGAGDLFRMYTRYFDTLGWTYELLTENEGSVGGFSKVVLDVSGVDVYGKLKFESGAHRVQRVPETEASGRVHTSAATVVVMPKLEIEDVDVNKADLRVDTFRSSGAGGQHVNKTESGVRFTHLPTGIVAESTDSRSQHKNREIAMGRLIQKIKDVQIETYEKTVASERRSLVGTGDRSDKIRTYNFPQNRMTDHRINYTSYNLVGLINGQLDDVIEALRVAENMEKLKGEQD